MHWFNNLSKIKLTPLQEKEEIQTDKIGLNFVDTNLNYETFLENNKCWCCGHLNGAYILLGHPVFRKNDDIGVYTKYNQKLFSFLEK